MSILMGSIVLWPMIMINIGVMYDRMFAVSREIISESNSCVVKFRYKSRVTNNAVIDMVNMIISFKGFIGSPFEGICAKCTL